MGGTHKHSNFFKDKPVFGFDLGHGSLKVMQVDGNHSIPKLLGYGTTAFDPSAAKEGVILKPEVIAQSVQKLFKDHLIGTINTKRVAVSIPAYRAFSRSMQLPRLKSNELDEAVRLEVEQYIPIPLEELYYDYRITHQTDEQTELFAVAIPKEIVDSYLVLMRLMGLETVVVETTMAAAARLFANSKHSDLATVIMDLGSLSSDISIFHNEVLVTGTVGAGGLVFTNSLRDKLGVSEDEAATIKTKYGLANSKKQTDIRQALEPNLQLILKEIERMMRYYEERYGNQQKIGQVVVLGGGANMPGLSDYFTGKLRLPVRTHDPWNYLDFKGMQPPSEPDHLMYATVAGLALLKPKEVFNHE
jgi:type IV pilus assembly protein PilM